MGTSTVEFVNAGATVVSALAAVFLAFFAYLALSQISILESQSEDQKRQSRVLAIATREGNLLIAGTG